VIKNWFIPLVLLLSLILPWQSVASVDGDTYVTASAKRIDAIEACKSMIMTAGPDGFERMSSRKLIDACDDFPLSDDIFVQILGAIIGQDFVLLLDVYSGLTGNDHGFDSEETLFSVAKPLHDVFGAINLLFFGFFIALTLINIGIQVFVRSSGDDSMTMREWVLGRLPSVGLTGLLTAPIIGWMTPLQALALVFIVMMGFLAKLAVTYLFLAAFFGNVAGEIKKSVKWDIEAGVGKSILMYSCDLSRRESLISSIQVQIGSRGRVELESNGLFQCLTSGASVNNKLITLDSVVDGVVRYEFTPSSLVQTQNCIDTHAADLSSWGAFIPEPCGTVDIQLPNNTAVPNSVNNVIELYSNGSTSKTLRNVALMFNEYTCRTAESMRDFQGGVVSMCLMAELAGSAYRYEFKSDKLTGTDEVAFYSNPLVGGEKDVFLSKLNMEVSSLQDGVSGNTPGMMKHLRDLVAPFANEADLPTSTKKKLIAVRSQFDSDDTGSAIGVSEVDVDFLVNNIRKGAWASSSLFYGSMSDGMNDARVVELLKNTYRPAPNANYDNLLSSDLRRLSSMSSGDTFSDIQDLSVKSASAVGGFIIPRIDLYTSSLGCWYQQRDCDAPPLNPFTYLGERGAQLIDQAITGYLASSLIHTTSKMLLGVYKKLPKKKEKNIHAKVMFFETLAEFQMLYIILGVVLAIIIPLIPLLKLMVMMLNWSLDVIKELIGLQIKLGLSPLSNHGDEVISQDVRESFHRLIGLGYYFLFVVVGLIVVFFMYSFLFALNVFLVGSLFFSVTSGSSLSAIDSMVLNMVFDVIITFLLVFEVIKCSPYMEKVPKAIVEHFGISVSPSEGSVSQIYHVVRGQVASSLADFMHGRGFR
jgi:hypothetical protein